MSTFNDSKTHDGGSDADRNAPDLGNGNSCGEQLDLIDQLDPLNQLDPLDPLEKIRLLQSIDNVLVMLQGQSTLEIVRTIAVGLLRFPRHIVDRVCSEAVLHLECNPVPSEFMELARKFYGVTHEDLLYKGRAAFYSLANLKEPDHDLVCEDWRSVFAVKHGFLSLKNFFSAWTEEKPYSKQQRFAEAYASIDFFDESTVTKEYFLAGSEYRMSISRRRLNFVGNYETCLQILSTLPNANKYEIPNPPQTPDETLYTFGRKGN